MTDHQNRPADGKMRVWNPATFRARDVHSLANVERMNGSPDFETMDTHVQTTRKDASTGRVHVFHGPDYVGFAYSNNGQGLMMFERIVGIGGDPVRAAENSNVTFVAKDKIKDFKPKEETPEADKGDDTGTRHSWPEI